MTENTAKHWNDKGYFPTADIRGFRISKSWFFGNTYLLKQKWESQFGYESIWLELPQETGEDL